MGQTGNAEDIRQNSRLKVKGEFLESESFNHNEPERTIYDYSSPTRSATFATNLQT